MIKLRDAIELLETIKSLDDEDRSDLRDYLEEGLAKIAEEEIEEKPKRHYKKREHGKCKCGKKLHHMGRCKGHGKPGYSKYKNAADDPVYAAKLAKEEEYMAHARAEG